MDPVRVVVFSALASLVCTGLTLSVTQWDPASPHLQLQRPTDSGLTPDGEPKTVRTYANLPLPPRSERGHPENYVCGMEKNEAVLRLVTRAFEEAGIEWWLTMGTLLGFTREGDLLPNDHDADIAMWADEFSPEVIRVLSEAGLGEFMYDADAPRINYAPVGPPFWGSRPIQVLYHARPIENCNIKYLDLWLIHRESEYYWQSQNNGWFHWPWLPFRLCPADFLGLSVKVPCDVERVMLQGYGPGYMTPYDDHKGKGGAKFFYYKNEKRFPEFLTSPVRVFLLYAVYAPLLALLAVLAMRRVRGRPVLPLWQTRSSLKV